METLLKPFARHITFSLRFSENTVSSYTLDVKLFLEYILEFYGGEQNLLQALNLLKLDDYRKYLSFKIKERNCGARTNARTISALKCFFKFLRTNNYIEENSILKLKFPKLSALIPKSLEEEEMIVLMDAFKKRKQTSESNWKNSRDEALTFLIYSSGLRISESLSLNKKDFMKNSNFLRITGKGNKERIVPILEEAKAKIQNYLNQIPVNLMPDHPLFITERKKKRAGPPKRLSAREFQQTIQDARHSLNLPDFTTPHAFRHSFATHIIKNGGSIRNVQSLLGHSSLSTTQKYVKIDSKLLTAAYNKFHPKS